MNQLTNPSFIKDLFRHYGLKPKDYMGQNFLVDEDALASIVNAGNIKKSDVVLEVGPGLGVLTQQLAQRAKQVIAVEKDRTLIDILNFNMAEFKNFTLYNQDILSFNLNQQISSPYKVVSNIPYYLTSHLFQYFLDQPVPPQVMVFLIQKEVGQRVTARPGEMSVLAVSVQLRANVELVADVSKRSFWPSPKVDSVVVKLTPKNKYPQVTDTKKFFRIVKVGFAAKRKQLHNNLVNGLQLPLETVNSWLQQNNIDPKTRAQDLSLDDWVNLYLTYPE